MFADLTFVTNKTLLSVMFRVLDVTYQSCQPFVTSFVPLGHWLRQHLERPK